MFHMGDQEAGRTRARHGVRIKPYPSMVHLQPYTACSQSLSLKDSKKLYHPLGSKHPKHEPVGDISD